MRSLATQSVRRLCVLGLLLGLMIGSQESLAANALRQDLQSGHWVVVKGSYDKSQNKFFAEEIVVTEPDDEVVLIGRIKRDRRGKLSLLGFALDIESDAKYRDLSPEKLEDTRVKAEGDWPGGQHFVVESLSRRGAGRERLEGPLVVSRLSAGESYSVLGVALGGVGQAEISTEGSKSLASLARLPTAPQTVSGAAVDDDDEFGDGLAIGRYLRLTHRAELQSSRESDFNFDADDEEDRQDVSAGLRSRLDWRPPGRYTGVAELRLNHRRREQQDEPNSKRTEAQFGEVWLQARLSERTAITAGRQDFDDRREWLFDTNLDALRFTHRGRRVNLEASVSTRFNGDDSRQDSARNLMLYLSNSSDERHIAGYIIQREFDLDDEESSLHIGGRLVGEWWQDTSVWLEGAHQTGRRQQRDVDAWALDSGMTWFPMSDDFLYLTAGLAHASGDDPDTPNDEAFRQSGLQDNNGKFGGVTSFRYYGELSDPELSNMTISTLGAGSRPSRNLSIDLVAHSYHLSRLADEVADAEWDADLTGEARFLGWEADLVVGVRGRDRWSLEAVLGYFEPGKAFEDRDSSYFGKLQLRVRI